MISYRYVGERTQKVLFVLAPLRFEDLQFEDAVCGLCAFAMFCFACSFATRGQLLQFYCHLYRGILEIKSHARRRSRISASLYLARKSAPSNMIRHGRQPFNPNFCPVLL